MSAKRVAAGVLAAVWVSVLVGLVATVIGFVGVGRYLEDYCFTGLQCPLRTETGCGGGPVEFRSPVTLRCVYDAGVAAQRVDPLPLLFGTGVGAGALVVIAATWWTFVGRPARDREMTMDGGIGSGAN